MKPDELRYLVDSVFLHPQLPHEEEKDCRRKDNLLLEFVSSSATAFSALLVGPAGTNNNAALCWMRITRMLQTMVSLHSPKILSKKSIQSALLDMQANGAIHVPRHGNSRR